jgi:hypothetical protein
MTDLRAFPTVAWSGVLLCLAACGGTSEVITPPPPPPVGFAFTFAPDPEDVPTATPLGWQNGIAGLAFTVTPADSSAPTRAFTASGTGTHTVPDLTARDYIIEGSRWLTGPEKALLPSGNDALGFAGRWTVRASAQGGSARLEVPAARRKGLVISEWAFNGYGYSYGGFLELHNNADTTVYLDGLVLGEGWWASLDAGGTPCAVSAPFRDDPQGIWARFFQQFPGTGRDFALAAGATTVIATDGIDHRPLNSRSLDLSGADFEFSGLADADNPTVPNMMDVGLIPYPTGHGSQFFGLVNVPFISRAVNVATLTRAIGPSGNTEWARFPAGAIIDAFAMGTNYLPPAGFVDCPPLVNVRFDRKESRARGTDDFTEYVYSLSRRRVPTTGTAVMLQWTRSGNADFLRTARSPGVP